MDSCAGEDIATKIQQSQEKRRRKHTALVLNLQLARVVPPVTPSPPQHLRTCYFGCQYCHLRHVKHTRTTCTNKLSLACAKAACLPPSHCLLWHHCISYSTPVAVITQCNYNWYPILIISYMPRAQACKGIRTVPPIVCPRHVHPQIHALAAYLPPSFVCVHRTCCRRRGSLLHAGCEWVCSR